jgi:hypothetical protein
MNTFTQTPIRRVAPSGPGALSGFETACSCGLVIRSSILSMVRADLVGHQSWHLAMGHVLLPVEEPQGFWRMSDLDYGYATVLAGGPTLND